MTQPADLASHCYSLRKKLSEGVGMAFEALELDVDFSPLIRPSDQPDVDFQADGAFVAAKQLGCSPRKIANQLLEEALLLSQFDNFELSVSGPGFINFKLPDDYICQFLDQGLEEVIQRRLKLDCKETIVVDFSSPNLAKEMHVGHLRSTIIGDAVAEILVHLGHEVIRQNHVGDWGTQFGMLIAYMQALGEEEVGTKLADLETFYQAARRKFDQDQSFADQARAAVVALHEGDSEYLKLWKAFTEISLSHCQAIYDQLGVHLTDKNLRGESAYRDDLAGVVEACEKANIVTESENAKCVFLEEILGRDKQPLPLIIQKSDGAYLYATSDLAAIRYRYEKLQADRVLYFVDARQTLHFRQVIAVAKKAGLCSPEMLLQHMPFGVVTDGLGKPLKTRDGGVLKLHDLLHEAQVRAVRLAEMNNSDLSSEQCQTIGRIVGIGAIKYADLSRNRAQNYIFDWDQILSLEGNTGPYLQYAYARIASIFGREEIGINAELPKLEALSGSFEPPERELGIHLGDFGWVLGEAANKGEPHLLCNYLYNLAVKFSRFYQACPVLKAGPKVRNNRLRLCQLTAKTLKTGLGLLGIEVTERM